MIDRRVRTRMKLNRSAEYTRQPARAAARWKFVSSFREMESNGISLQTSVRMNKVPPVVTEDVNVCSGTAPLKAVVLDSSK